MTVVNRSRVVSMNVSVSRELERFVRESVEKRLYRSASEVVREALRLLQEVQQLRETHRALADARLRDLQLDVIGSLFQKDLRPHNTRASKPKWH